MTKSGKKQTSGLSRKQNPDEKADGKGKGWQFWQIGGLGPPRTSHVFGGDGEKREDPDIPEED